MVGLRASMVAGAVFAFGLSTAEAAVIFDYASTCNANCAQIGLSTGDPVSGWFAFADAAVVPNAIVRSADILAFALDFGTVDITSATAVGIRFAGVLSNTGNAFLPFTLTGFTAETLFPTSGDSVRFAGDGFSAGPGACLSPSCDGSFQNHLAHGFFATLTLRETPVAEPATLALLGAGLFGLGLARRRQIA